MVVAYHQFEQALQANKQSVTQPRRIVFEALQHKEPLTMHELMLACGDNIDRASLYRIVALFERLGIVQRLQIGWKYRLELSNSFQEHHHHLTCTVCATIIPLHEDSALEQRLSDIATQQNFTAHDHQLEIRGICARCQVIDISA
jgi:Fur family ferric uptake transcriptional regulator